MRIKQFFIIFVLVLPLGCLEDIPPSTGHCSGAIGEQHINDDIYAPESDFYRDDQQHGVEHAYVEMSFGTDLSEAENRNISLTIKGHLRDMPYPHNEGEHRLVEFPDCDDYVDEWELHRFASDCDDCKTHYQSGNLVLTAASRTRITGHFSMTFSDHSSLNCDIDLGRNYDKDTDDHLFQIDSHGNCR